MPNVSIKRFSRSKASATPEVVARDPDIEMIPMEKPPVDAVRDIELDDTEDGGIENDFLKELNNDIFVSQSQIEKTEKERLKEAKELEKQQKLIDREQKQTDKKKKETEKANKKATKDTQTKLDDALFSEKGSELYGRDRLELIAKVQQYKTLFPENKRLKDLKIKKNATIEELQSYVAECSAIVDTDTVESFVTDSILSTMKMAEYASIRTKYNIKGLSEMLRKNPQFNSLCKQLYIKYKVFSKVPPETQMLLLITTSAWICMEKNKQDEKVSTVLSKTVDPKDFI
jgi:Fe-S cluster assembly scaffold protein SufB